MNKQTQGKKTADHANKGETAGKNGKAGKENPAGEAGAPASNFLRAAIEADIAAGTYAGRVDADGRPLPTVITRFPPEPNGYLHIGHAKSICLNFGLARDYSGRCHMRFDDTNPTKEEQEYVDTILDSVQWLGFEWRHEERSHLYYASDYFDMLYAMAEYLIGTGHAYVDSQSADEMAANRGSFSEPGRNSRFRDRPIRESLDLFRRMKAGEFKDGEHVIRAKIDMASPNMNMRDPAIYRIRHAHHHRTGDKWCVYPMYDYAHPIEDAIEYITHSFCTLEFQDHRPFYDWVLIQLIDFFTPEPYKAYLAAVAAYAKSAAVAVVELARSQWDAYRPNGANPFLPLLAAVQAAKADGDAAKLEEYLAKFVEQLRADNYFTLTWFGPKLHSSLETPNSALDPAHARQHLPQQIEFARLNLTYSITGKRKLLQMVNENTVDGWDDPRLPTVVGLRRRGYTPESIQLFCERIGVAKSDSWIDMSTLEAALRDDLDPKAPRATAVLDPLKLIIDNYPEGKSEECSAPVHPHHPERGVRAFPFSRELWIEAEDFMEEPSKGYFRLYPGNRVRLRYGFVVECTGCDKDENGKVIAVHCNYFEDSKSGTEGSANYKVKGNIHWVSAAHALQAEVRLYERLFLDPQPDSGGKNFLDSLNPHAKSVVTAYLEPGLKDAQPGQKFQFERHGYFVADIVDSQPGRPVFNRAVTLKDSWGKQ